MIAMVFLLIGANLLFTCFSFQGNATEISSEIVNVPVLTQFELTIPVQIAKHYLTFFQNAANRCLLYRICCLYCFISKSETNQKTSDIYLIAIQIGSGTPFMVKTSFKGNVVRIWQLAVSEKSEKSKEFHRRTKHFVNSHTQKLLSNPLDFPFSIFKKMETWKSNCRKNTLKTLWLMKLENSTWKQIGQVNLKTVINIASGMKPLEHKFLRNFHFHVWEFHFRKFHFRANSPKRNVTSAVLKNRNQNLKSNICRTRHVTSRRWILPSAEMHITKISLHFTMFLSTWKPKKGHVQRTKDKTIYHWIA